MSELETIIDEAIDEFIRRDVNYAISHQRTAHDGWKRSTLRGIILKKLVPNVLKWQQATRFAEKGTPNGS